MDRLWSPWRAAYIASGDTSKEAGCVFCKMAREAENDEAHFVLHRGQYSFVVLNLYPYISGHLLVVPYEHVGELDAASKQVTDELMDLTKRSQSALREAYRPSGFNVGMNLGAAAGAGIVEHIHIHVMPRWTGDTNFMTTIAETRVLPEELETTYRKLRGKF